MIQVEHNDELSMVGVDAPLRAPNCKRAMFKLAERAIHVLTQPFADMRGTS